MKRLFGPVLGLTVLGVAAGFVLGLAVGTLIFPVSFTGIDLANLRPEQKDDFVMMVSAAYALDRSLADARQRLAQVEPDPAKAEQKVTALAYRAIERNDVRNARNLSALAVALGAGAPALSGYLATVAAPTAVPTFTPTPTLRPAALLAADTPTATAKPTDTRVPATSTPRPPTPTASATPTRRPPTATFTRRPPTATFTPAPPTDTPTPSVGFRVVEQRMKTNVENGGRSTNGTVEACGLDHTYYITVIDINGVPLSNVIVRRRFSTSTQIPPTGSKGPGKTEDPAYGGDKLYVYGDTSGSVFTSEETRALSESDEEIPISDFIAGLYCRDQAECQQRISENRLCRGHYSYNVVFQRQW